MFIHVAPFVMRIMFVWCLIAGHAMAEPVQLELRNVAHVKLSNLVLADVVNVDDITQKKEIQLLAMPIGTISMTMGKTLVERKSLEMWVRQHAGAHGRDIRWVGAKAVNIILQTQLVNAEYVRKQARAVLEDWIKSNVDSNNNIEIKDQYDLKPLIVPTGEVKLRVSHLSEPLSIRRKVSVILDVLVSDQVVKSIPVLFEVSGYKQALLVKHDIARGELIREADVELKVVDVFTELNNSVSQSDFAKAAVRARLRLRKGDILNGRNIETVPDVARGDFVVLMVYEGLVSIESRGKAMQDGYIGQVINVCPSNTNNQILAKIVEPGKVELR